MTGRRLVILLAVLWMPATTLPAQGPARPANLHLADPIRNPRFVPAAAATFLQDSDLILGVAVDGVAKAYYTTGIAYHHVIEDRLGPLPILVTW